MVKSFLKIFILFNLTYSSNILLLTQRFYDVENFVEAALLFAIFYSFYTIIGGSIRLLGNKNINDEQILSISLLRLFIGISLICGLLFFDQNFIVFMIIVRKTSEWVSDPLITFTKNYQLNKSFFIIILDFILLFLLIFNIKTDLFISLWVFIPIINVLFITLINKKFNWSVNFTNILNLDSAKSIFGFEGPQSLLAILFRGFVKFNSNAFLVDALFLTMVFSAALNVILKVIMPSFKAIKLNKIFESPVLKNFLIINVLILICLAPLSDTLPYVICLYLFGYFFSLQFIAMLSRQTLIQENKIYLVLKIEILISFVTSLFLVAFVYFDYVVLLGWFYLVNALFNWIFYSYLANYHSIKN